MLGGLSISLSELLEGTHLGEWVAAVRTALHLVTSPALGSLPCSWQEDGRVCLLLGPSCSHSLPSPSVSAFGQVVAVLQQRRKDVCLPWCGLVAVGLCGSLLVGLPGRSLLPASSDLAALGSTVGAVLQAGYY